MELPPSLGRESMRTRARELAALLYDAGFGMVATSESYTQLEERLVSGEADAAWGPPLVCARVEAQGGRVALRALRDGASTYRAVLVARAQDSLNLADPAHVKRRPRASWVDTHSMAGYVLPRAFLRSLGLDLGHFLVEEQMLGSYEKCIAAVLDGHSDLTSTFAGPSDTLGDGYVTIAGKDAVELRAVAYTPECPNDGVVLSPKLAPPAAEAMTQALAALVATPAARDVMAHAFSVTGFERPPAGSYLPLLALELHD
jgi:phosphonate transport system substrate-binding protein